MEHQNSFVLDNEIAEEFNFILYKNVIICEWRVQYHQVEFIEAFFFYKVFSSLLYLKWKYNYTRKIKE